MSPLAFLRPRHICQPPSTCRTGRPLAKATAHFFSVYTFPKFDLTIFLIRKTTDSRSRVTERYDITLGFVLAFAFAFFLSDLCPGPGPLRSSPGAPDLTALADSPAPWWPLDAINLASVCCTLGSSFRLVGCTCHKVNPVQRYWSSVTRLLDRLNRIS